VPINERLGEENVVHMHNRILFNHKKEWNFLICDNIVEPKRHYISDISQAQKDKYHMVSPQLFISKK
jgi:hypothetical protein